MKDRLHTLMTSYGLTSGRLAEKIGVQPSAISHVLSGRNKPGFDFINKLLLAFPNVDSRWLITGIGTPFVNQPGASDDHSDRESVDIAGNAHITTLDRAIQNSDPGSESLGQSGFYRDEGADDTSHNIDLGLFKDLPNYGASSGRIHYGFVPEGFSAQNGNIVDTAHTEVSYKDKNVALSNEDINADSSDYAHPSPKSDSEISGRKATKVIIFYNDRSFEAYTPSTSN